MVGLKHFDTMNTQLLPSPHTNLSKDQSHVFEHEMASNSPVKEGRLPLKRVCDWGLNQEDLGSLAMIRRSLVRDLQWMQSNTKVKRV